MVPDVLSLPYFWILTPVTRVSGAGRLFEYAACLTQQCLTVKEYIPALSCASPWGTSYQESGPGPTRAMQTKRAYATDNMAHLEIGFKDGLEAKEMETAQGPMSISGGGSMLRVLRTAAFTGTEIVDARRSYRWLHAKRILQSSRACGAGKQPVFRADR